MDYKEFFVEERDRVDLENLVARHIPKDQYISAHKNTIIVCADVLIYYNWGYLLVQRDNVPAKGELWPIGGRLQRGISVEEGIEKSKRRMWIGIKKFKLGLHG